MTTTTYCVIFAAIVFEVTGQVCLKRGAVSPTLSGRAGGLRHFWTAVAQSGWTYAGISAYAVELFLWIAALHFAPLSQAFPLMSLSYCGVGAASRLLLKERIPPRSVIGITLITLGAICIVGANA